MLPWTVLAQYAVSTKQKCTCLCCSDVCVCPQISLAFLLFVYEHTLLPVVVFFRVSMHIFFRYVSPSHPTFS